MSPQPHEELAYLQEALALLKESLSRAQNPKSQNLLRTYIAKLERRISEAQKKEQGCKSYPGDMFRESGEV